MKVRPSDSSISWIVQMFGWFREDAALASRWKRLRACVVVGEFVGKELQGDVATELEVFRLIHHTHPAAANLAEYAVGNRLPHGLRRGGHQSGMVGCG